MTKSRLEAFSDGVIAVIITIMVLELKVPQGAGWDALAPLTPVFLSYVLSFVFVGIYWNNHHHMLQLVEHVNGGILWANLHLLFWLSLIPFANGWIGANHFATLPIALYGVVLLCAGIAYYILERLLIRRHGKDSAFVKALGRDFKGQVSLVLYALAIPLAFVNTWLAFGLYAVVALMWLCPDPRVERTLANWNSAEGRRPASKP
jgi:uncharacterized membrane protein